MNNNRNGPYTPTDEADPTASLIQNIVRSGIEDHVNNGDTPANNQQVIYGATPRTGQFIMQNQDLTGGSSRFDQPQNAIQVPPGLDDQQLATPLAQQLGVSDHHLGQLRKLVYQDLMNEHRENATLVQNNNLLKQDVISLSHSPTHNVQINQVYQTILNTIVPELPPMPDEDMGQTEEHKREYAAAEERRKSLQIATDRFGP